LLIASTTVAACVGSAVGGIFYVLVDDSAQAISL
jgi:hypothetical protein